MAAINALEGGGFEDNDFSDEVLANRLIRRGMTATKIDGVKALHLGDYTVSADPSLDPAAVRSYVETAQRGWTVSGIDSDGTVYATSIRLRLVARNGNFKLMPCVPNICTTGLGAADLGGTIACYSASQRVNTPVHEFGHMFGLGHQSPWTYSIMSNSLSRSVQVSDIKRLFNTYQRGR
jgi:uncharacterized Zn-binding protein involved in type VI secretion